MPLLTKTAVLYAISELEAYRGNAPDYEIYQQFVARGPGENQKLQEVLGELEAQDFIVRDGMREDGLHYALTRKGKNWLVRQDLRPAA